MPLCSFVSCVSHSTGVQYWAAVEVSGLLRFGMLPAAVSKLGQYFCCSVIRCLYLKVQQIRPGVRLLASMFRAAAGAATCQNQPAAKVWVLPLSVGSLSSVATASWLCVSDMQQLVIVVFAESCLGKGKR